MVDFDSRLNLARLLLYRANDELDTANLLVKNTRYNAAIRQAYASILFSFHAIIVMDGRYAKRADEILQWINSGYVEKRKDLNPLVRKALEACAAKCLTHYEAAYEATESEAEFSIEFAVDILREMTDSVQLRMRGTMEGERQNYIKKFKKKIEKLPLDVYDRKRPERDETEQQNVGENDNNFDCS